jgi:uncharacterized membrane protein YobD (UPF0266 family)
MIANAEPGDGGPEARGTTVALKKHTQLSVAIFVLGVVLMIIVGYVEDDPTIPPFVMMAVGIAWFAITRYRIRAHTKRPNA